MTNISLNETTSTELNKAVNAVCGVFGLEKAPEIVVVPRRVKGEDARENGTNAERLVLDARNLKGEKAANEIVLQVIHAASSVPTYNEYGYCLASVRTLAAGQGIKVEQGFGWDTVAELGDTVSTALSEVNFETIAAGIPDVVATKGAPQKQYILGADSETKNAFKTLRQKTNLSEKELTARAATLLAKEIEREANKANKPSKPAKKTEAPETPVETPVVEG